MALQPTRYVIVGNGVAGTTAAEHLRKHDPAASIHLFTDEPYPLYNRVALPRFLRGTTSEDKVMIRDREWHARHRIELHLETRVERVDVREKVVRTAAGDEYPYDRVLVATGGRPNAIPAEGGDAQGICYFQTLDDTKALIEHILRSRHAVSIGGSYISYELAEGFRHRGLEVTWIMRGPRFLRRILDEEGGELVHRIATHHGVRMVYGEEIAAILTRNGAVRGVRTTSGREIDCDLVGCGLGLTYNVELLEGSGVEVKKAIVTDEHLQTNVPDVFAAGDVAEFFDVVLGGHNQMGTWNNSLCHGRVVAANMLGGRQVFEDVPMYTTTMFDSVISVAGLTPENRKDLESAVHVDFEQRNYRKLFFLEDRLVGLAMIGDMKGRKKLLDLIRSKQPVGGDYQGLLKASFT